MLRQLAIAVGQRAVLSTPGVQTLGLFRLQITPTVIAPTPAPVVNIDWGTPG